VDAFLAELAGEDLDMGRVYKVIRKAEQGGAVSESERRGWGAPGGASVGRASGDTGQPGGEPRGRGGHCNRSVGYPPGPGSSAVLFVCGCYREVGDFVACEVEAGVLFFGELREGSDPETAAKMGCRSCPRVLPSPASRAPPLSRDR